VGVGLSMMAIIGMVLQDGLSGSALAAEYPEGLCNMWAKDWLAWWKIFGKDFGVGALDIQAA